MTRAQNHRGKASYYLLQRKTDKPKLNTIGPPAWPSIPEKTAKPTLRSGSTDHFPTFWFLAPGPLKWPALLLVSYPPPLDLAFTSFSRAT